jgi:hypothetical protein
LADQDSTASLRADNALFPARRKIDASEHLIGPVELEQARLPEPRINV